MDQLWKGFTSGSASVVSELNYFAVGCVVQDALLLIQLQQTSRMAEFGPTTVGSSSCNLHTSQPGREFLLLVDHPDIFKAL